LYGIKRADAPFDTQPLQETRDEIEELMFRNIYPRYILVSEINMQKQTGLVQCGLTADDDFIKPKKQNKQKREKRWINFYLIILPV
jgi:hypothetical protein